MHVQIMGIHLKISHRPHRNFTRLSRDHAWLSSMPRFCCSELDGLHVYTGDRTTGLQFQSSMTSTATVATLPMSRHDHLADGRNSAPKDGTAVSGFITDAHKVGTSTVCLRCACAGQPAGLAYTREGVLYYPVAYALVIDALTHLGALIVSRAHLQILLRWV